MVWDAHEAAVLKTGLTLPEAEPYGCEAPGFKHSQHEFWSLRAGQRTYSLTVLL